MPTTAQPSAGTALHADWTTSLVARNEAETTASTLAAGSATRSVIGDGVQFLTDSDGRYLRGVTTGSGSKEEWAGISAGSERTLMVIVKRVATGASQALIDSDDGGTRLWQWTLAASGVVSFLGWNSGSSLDANFSSTETVSTSAPVTVIVRIRDDGGVYKAKIWVGSVATSEVSYSGTPKALSTNVSLGDRRGGSQRFDSNIYWWGIWDRALSDTDCDTLAANGWAVYDAASPSPASAIPVIFSNYQRRRV